MNRTLPILIFILIALGVAGGSRTYTDQNDHTNADGSEHSYIDQDVTTDGTPSHLGLYITANGEVRWYDNGNYVGFEAGALDANQIWVLPLADSTGVGLLSSNGSGVLSFIDPNGAGSVAHNLISATHLDTTTDAVTRGSIIYGNSTPAWDELVLGAANTYLRSDGTDAGWLAITLGTNTSGNYVASITNGAGITGGDGGSEGAALTITATLGTAIDTTEITDNTIEIADVNMLNTPADEDIVVYDTATGGGFKGMTPSELITAGTNIAWTGTTLNVSSGGGVGDMLKSTYDVAEDDFVDANDTTYASSWNGTINAPSMNVVYDYLHLLDTDDDGDVDSVDAGAVLDEEEVEDFVGGMVTGGTETHIGVTYTDGGVGAGVLNFVVDPDSVAGSISAGAYNDNTVGVADLIHEDFGEVTYASGSAVVESTHSGSAHHAAVTLTGQDYLTLSTQQITMGEIEPDDLASSDFGDFTSNGTTSTLDTNVVQLNELDVSDVSDDIAGDIAAGELTDDSVNNDDINWADISNLGDQGAVTLAATVTVSDDESTDDDQEIVFTTDNTTLESDGDFHYSPDTGTVTATEFVGGGSGLTLASTDLSDTADLLYEAELDDFSELQTQIGDKTLINEEDVATIDSAWTFSADLTLSEDLIIADAKYIGSATTPGAIQIEGDGDVVLTDDLYLPGQLYHTGDTDTYMNFSISDSFSFICGGETLLALVETGQDYIELGDDGDVDIKLSAGADGALTVEGSSGNVSMTNDLAVTGSADVTGTLDIADVTTITYTGADATVFEIDASGSSVSNAPGFLVKLPAAGSQKGFQIVNASDGMSWASFEFGAGGASKPGFALGPGGAALRDTNIYRDSANVLKTDDALTVGSLLTVEGQTAQIGSTEPFYLISNSPTMGLNAYYSGGWKFGAGSSSDYGGAIDLTASSGELRYRVTTAAGNAGGAATMVERFSIIQTGLVSIGNLTPTAQLHVDQSSASGAKPVLRLDQGDVDDSFIDFIGTSAGDATKSISTLTTSGATTHHIRCEINGATVWIAASTNDPS